MPHDDTPLENGALDPQRVGRAVAHFRELRGLTLVDLGERSGVAKSYIHKLEHGEAPNPGLRTLDALARALGITLQELLAVADPEHGALEHVRSDVVELAQLRSTAPEALQQFLAEQEARDGAPLPDDTVRSLLLLKMRGKRPETVEEWRLLYEVLIRMLR